MGFIPFRNPKSFQLQLLVVDRLRGQRQGPAGHPPVGDQGGSERQQARDGGADLTPDAVQPQLDRLRLVRMGGLQIRDDLLEPGRVQVVVRYVDVPAEVSE